MRFLITFPLSIYLLLPVCLGLGLAGEAAKEKHSQDQTVETPMSKNYFNGHTPAPNFYTYFLSHSDEDEEYVYNDNVSSDPPKTLQKREEKKVVTKKIKDDDEDFLPLDPLLLSEGPLEKRHFVSVEILPRTGKKVESSFYFRGKRQQDDNKDTDEEFEKPSKRVNETVIQDLRQVPANFNTSSLVIYYAHQLTAVEKAGDSKAKLGSPCKQTTILEPDYCEKASFPNKNKMVCNGVDDTRMPSLKYGTCICKFYRAGDGSYKWKQMKTGSVILNGEEVKTCLVPKYGVCNHRIFTGYLDDYGRPIYEVDICRGHIQCDNSELFAKLKNGNKTLDVRKHCTEEDFLQQFDDSVKDKVLLCAKPSPRSFSNYDEFKFYCLSKNLRDPALPQYKPADSVDMKAKEFF